MRKLLVIIAGPTGVGKTELSISLAKEINGAVISADSMQVYKGMNIGTAKIHPEEMNGVPHYLIDVLEPSETFHVKRFQEMAKEALNEIYSNEQIPIIVGGTGFYIQALLYDIHFSEELEAPEIRRKYEAIAREEGAVVLHRMLMEKDPQAAMEIHPNNVKKVIRALEFYSRTGDRISEHNMAEKARKSPYNSVFFVLNDQRGHLYQRIDQRVDNMISAGLVEEVRQLLKEGYTRDMVSMQGLGYKEVMEYLEGECSLSEAVYKVKRDSRHFAKRQITWFKREKDAIWIDKSEYNHDCDKILKKMMYFIDQKRNTHI